MNYLNFFCFFVFSGKLPIDVAGSFDENEETDEDEEEDFAENEESDYLTDEGGELHVLRYRTADLPVNSKKTKQVLMGAKE